MPSRLIDLPDKGFLAVHEDDPFTVPAGRVFHIKALGFDTLKNIQISLCINGTQVVEILHAGGNEVSMVQLPDGLAAGPGDVITLITPTGPPNDGRAWGLLLGG